MPTFFSLCFLTTEAMCPAVLHALDSWPHDFLPWWSVSPETMSQDNPFLPLVAYVRYSVIASTKLFRYLPGMFSFMWCKTLWDVQSQSSQVVHSGPCSDEHALDKYAFEVHLDPQSWKNLISFLLLNKIPGATAFNWLHSDLRMPLQ